MGMILYKVKVRGAAIPKSITKRRLQGQVSKAKQAITAKVRGRVCEVMKAVTNQKTPAVHR